MELQRITVNQADFDKKFSNNISYPNIDVLQNEFDELVKDYNRILDLHGFHSKTQIAMDKIMLLKNKLES